MKTVRIFVIILICLLLLPSVVISADSIFYVDTNNDYFEQHRSQMVYLERRFIVNGEDGFVSLREAPGAKDETGRLQNGEEIVLYYLYLYDGDYWGITLDDGWVQMDQLLVLYDYVSFEKDHFDELYLYKGDYGEIKETRSAIAWPWPGADAPLWTADDIDMEYFYIIYAYTDSQGREWAFAESNDYGYMWICMSDLMNSDIPAFNPAPEPTKWVPETRHPFTQIEPTYNNVSGVSTESTDNTASGVSAENIDNNTSVDSSSQIRINTSGDSTEYTDIKTSENSMLWLIIGLVAAVVFGTAVLIRVFWKPNKKEQGGNANEDG